MGGKIEGASMNLKGVPSVIVVMAQWHLGGPEHVLGVFGGEDREKNANARIQEVLTNEVAPRATARIVGDFFVQ